MKKILTISILLFSFFSYSQPNTDIFLFDLAKIDGKLILSNGKNISNNEGYDNQPSFMDERIIFYSGTRNGQTDIVRYDIETGRMKWVSATEGSEYSPLKIPKKNRVSAIRLEKDGSQKLYKYTIKKNVSKPLIDNIIIGYQTWYDEETLISSVLEDGGLSLYITNLTEPKNYKVDTKIGRSLHKIPKTALASYISKKNEQWEIRSLNPTSAETEFIAQALPKSEDFCWTVNGTILMGRGDVLYKLNPKTDKYWKKVASLKKYGIKNITRLATSPNGSKIAIVGEPTIVDKSDTKEEMTDEVEVLEPVLENVAWIAGNWKGKAFGGTVEENWSEPSGDSMMAAFKHIKYGNVTFYELEIIREVNNTLMLQLKHFHGNLKGWETKDETVDFPLKEITHNKVVFEGMAFEKINENEMIVTVDIKQKDGSIQKMKFNYTKD